MGRVVSPAARAVVRRGHGESARFPDAQKCRPAAWGQAGGLQLWAARTGRGCGRAHALGTHQGRSSGDEGGGGPSLCSPWPHQAWPQLPAEAPTVRPRKGLKLILVPEASAGDPPCTRPRGLSRSRCLCVLSPSSLICYFSLNTPTPIISGILGNNSPSPNETCIIGRLPSWPSGD